MAIEYSKNIYTNINNNQIFQIMTKISLNANNIIYN